jgi:hypothetical protein
MLSRLAGFLGRRVSYGNSDESVGISINMRDGCDRPAHAMNLRELLQVFLTPTGDGERRFQAGFATIK